MKKLLTLVLIIFAVNSFAADGFLKMSGGTTITDPAIPSSGTNSILEYAVSNNVARGATAVFLDRPFTPSLTLIGYVAFGVYATNCEIRQLSGVASHQLSFNTPLAHAHSAGERVFYFFGPYIPIAWFGARSDSGINAGWALLQGLFEAAPHGLTLVGPGVYYTEIPLIAPPSSRLEKIKIQAKTGYPLTFTNSYMVFNQQGGRFRFTANTSDDVIISESTLTGLPVDATNVMMVFYTENGGVLPAPLSNGIPYFVRTNSATRFQVKLSQFDDTEINLTSAGTGTNFVYTEVGSEHELFWKDVTLEGPGTNYNVNGLWAAMEQPAYIQDSLRIQFFGGTGFRATGQQLIGNNIMIISCGVFPGTYALDTSAHYLNPATAGIQFMYVTGLNIEQCPRWWRVGNAAKNFINGFHAENNIVGLVDPFIDSTEGGTVIIKHASLGNGVGTNTFFKLGTDSLQSLTQLEDVSFGSASGRLPWAIEDIYNSKKISAYDLTNGAHRYIAHYSSSPTTDSPENYPDANINIHTWRGGGFEMWWEQDKFSPKRRMQQGTNQTGWQWQFQRSDGSTNMGFTASGGLAARQGPNARAGNVTLVGGTITTNNPSVTANTIAILSRKTAGGTIGYLTYTVSAGTSLTISAVDVTGGPVATDTSTVSYLLIENPTP